MHLYVNIKKQLGDRILHIEFETTEGVLGILGRSGIGKSITLKCIAGIETPDSGQIIYNGEIFFDSSKKINMPIQKRRVGYLFQGYALFPHLTVLQNISIACKDESSKYLINHFLKLFKIEDIQMLYPNQLSGGQKQRVALARMMVVCPEIILLDEPFSALDVILKQELQTELLNLFSQLPKIILIVSHDFDEIEKMCEQLLFVNTYKNTSPRVIGDTLYNPYTKQEAELVIGRNIVPVILQSEGKQIYIPEWEYTITLQESQQHFSHIAVEAHHMTLTTALDSLSFVAKDIRVVERPFSYYVTTQTPPLTLEVDKQQWEMHGNYDRIFITLDYKYIMTINE